MEHIENSIFKYERSQILPRELIPQNRMIRLHFLLFIKDL